MSYVSLTAADSIGDTVFVKKSSIDLVRKTTEHEPGNSAIQIRGGLYLVVEESVDLIMGLIDDEN